MNFLNSAYGSDEEGEGEVGSVAMAEGGIRSVVVGETTEEVPRNGPAFVTDVNARELLNDGSQDDPKWEKPDVDEVVTGKRNVDWRVDYAEYLGPRRYGLLVRRDRIRKREVGTKESAERLLAVLARLPEGVEVKEDEDGIRTLRMTSVGDADFGRSSER